MKAPLNPTASPLNYNISFHLDTNPKNSTFKGEETITWHIARPTKKLILHARDITLHSVTISDKTIPTSGIIYDSQEETYTFHVQEPLQPGKLTQSIAFTGTYGMVKGMYRSRYGNKGTEEYMITTQFEAADARAAFPCVDEPAAKATFDISIIHDQGLEAVSNTLPREISSLPNHQQQVTFETTPKMSTYPLYLGLGKYDTIQKKAGNVMVRIKTTPGKAEKLGHFALETAVKALQYYEKYFGIPYPLKKIDLLAIPDFESGAMENWGAITFREEALLIDPVNSSIADKQSVTQVISHELVHMWFGNLVTMQWWNDLWLNESFADGTAFDGMEITNPELDPWGVFLFRRASSAYSLDSLTTSHPINVDVKTPAEVRQIFDAISYSKGAMTLRMLQSMLGNKVYQQGIQKYLKKHQYGNAEGKDLWEALEEASGKPVGKMMDTWLNQMGMPVVDVQIKGTTLLLSQQKFTYLDNKDKTLWSIPLGITTNKGAVDALMEDKTMSIDLGYEPEWAKINSGEKGFYRVRYDKTLLDKLKKVITSQKLDRFDRWGVHRDVAALYIANQISLEDYLSFVLSTYAQEDDFLTLMDISSTLGMLRVLIGDTPALTSWKKRIVEWYASLLKRMGWGEKKGEKETDKLLRSTVLLGLGRWGDSEVLTRAEKLFEKPESIDPNLKATVYRLVAWRGNQATYEKFLSMYREAERKMAAGERISPSESRNILLALSDFQEKKLIERTLAWGLTKEVRPQNRMFITSVASINPVGRHMVWPWIKENWKDMKSYATEYLLNFNSMLSGLAYLADTSVSDEVEQFFTKNPLPGTEREIMNLKERMQIYQRCLQLR
jgi:tricorn protease interacting factor F2/3